MKKIFLSFIFLFFLIITVYSFPCPPECICKPTDTGDVDFTRMSYLIDCSNISLNNAKLIYHAQLWSIQEDRINDNVNDDDPINDYVISIDLSNSLSLKNFTDQTIQLTNFSYSLQSLSLSSQSRKLIIINSNAFNSPLYERLKILNLSSCCETIPEQCQQLFRPLIKLEVLDLSGSEMYKTCLDTSGSISSTVKDLILRNNIYDTNTFSHTSRYFDGIRGIKGKLDLQNSRFRMDAEVQGNCLFGQFQQITSLDISSVQFEPIINGTEIYLAHLLRCKNQRDGTRHGKQLTQLYLRQLQLQRLPAWFTDDRFPLLSQLDLSNNNIRSIDFRTYSNLQYISLAYNPIELKDIEWKSGTNYGLINLSSTIENRTFDLSDRLKTLLKSTINIDYSNNEGKIASNITNIPKNVDFLSSQFFLNLSRTNIYSFQSNWDDLLRLDISYNSLIELNLNEQVKLNYLDCSNQFLEKLILSDDLTALIELKCSNNSLITIEKFSFVKNDQLKFIDLSNNRINSLENLFGNLSSRYLHTINLKSNSIEMIPSNIFHQKLISLYEINLSWNKIHTLKNHAFQSPNLQILDLTGNLLKNIEPNAILTLSLRLFLIVNNTQQLIDRCVKSKSDDTLLSIYMPWFRENGAYMQNKQIYNDKQIQSNTCLTQHKSQAKTLLISTKGKHSFGYSTLFIVLASVSLVGVLFGGIVYYRKNQTTLLAPFRRYKKLDRQNLVENAAEMDQQQREEDEIVMNLDEPPYNTFNRRATNV